MQLYDLGVQIQKESLHRMDISSFRKATIRTYASARKRCTKSASGFLQGLQTIMEDDSNLKTENSKEIASEGGDFDFEGTVFMNEHVIETQKFKSNYLFETSRVCKGIYDNSYKKGTVLSKKMQRSLKKFLKRLETHYGFYLEHYVANPSPVNHLRFFTIYEIINYNLAEQGVRLLSENDSVWMEALKSYIQIKWYSTGDKKFIKTINQELISKITFNLDARNLWKPSKKKKSYDMVIYSGHDSSLLFLYMGFGLTSLDCLELIILKAQSQLDVSDLEKKKCLYKTEFADELRIELLRVQGSLKVVVRQGNTFFKIPNPDGWGSVSVCGREKTPFNSRRKPRAVLDVPGVVSA